ncbi:MAG: DUF4250 domain-containing protein [Verrucomicrobiota bacterium]
MNLRNYETMDPNLLLGLVNTTLRNDCENLEDLLRTHDLDEEKLCARLQQIGMEYQPELNQFRPSAKS